MIVVDTNVLAYLYFPSSQNSAVEELYKKNSLWIVPPLWRSEFRNIAALYFRKGLLSYEHIQDAMIKAEELVWGYEEPVKSDEVFALKKKSACSAYDCEFVALAVRLNVPLLTYDKKILQEFPEIAVTIEIYLGSHK